MISRLLALARRGLRTTLRRLPSPRPDDRYLASYPRSGNTWLRFFVAGLLTDEEPDFERVERLVPDIYRQPRREIEAQPGPRILKTHEPFNKGYFCAVYVVRDPRSVAVSYFHFLKRERRLSPETTFSDFLPRFLDGALDPFGPWDRHVASWRRAAQARPGRILVVRYEALRADPEAHLGQAASVLGLSADAEAIRRAVAAAQFERMQRLDRQREGRDPSLRGKDLRIPFVRSGAVDEWRRTLDAHQDALIGRAFGAEMAIHGYR